MIRTRRQAGPLRVPIAWKCFLLLAVVIPSMFAVAWVGGRGMANMKARLDAVYDDNVRSIQAVGHLATAMKEAEEETLLLVAQADPAAVARTRAELEHDVYPNVDRRLSELRSVSTGSDSGLAQELQAEWTKFVAFAESPEFLAASGGRAAHSQAVSSTVQALGSSLNSLLDRIDAREVRQAEAARQEAERTYGRSLLLLRIIAGLGLLTGVGVTGWLIRAVVVRVREYSAFAARVAAGELEIRARPRGHDELTDLGWALNAMVARGETVRGYEQSQGEFTEAMQVTETEEEAHGLLKRHLERSISGSAVVVLNRNNSADRLEATTELPPTPELVEKLPSAQPRDCLAVRLARPHHEAPGTEPLISCTLCRDIDSLKTCSPLLVGGEVIGSVLVIHGDPMNEEHLSRVRDSVTQAAPVLANLRNLAIAQLRAATDSLSGLPNARAVQDTLKRMVAQASRTMSPLSAVLLDLDHFKEINDTFGHPQGDEILAAVAVALQSTVRESDFVGRYGGEEFIMLLPDTGREAAVRAAERVREAIEEIQLLEGGRAVTASFGVAVFPDDAPDAARLVRSADRALYRAKANGRNRVEVFTLATSSDNASGGPGASEPSNALVSIAPEQRRP